MRNRLALPATLATMVLALTMGQTTRGQQETRRTPTRPGENQNANRDRGPTTEGETIHGIVAAVTAEGEATYDYRSNRAITANATFLTVVGSSSKSDAVAVNNHDTANTGEKRGSMAQRRHNVYMVWLTPRTKVCEMTAEYDHANPTERQRRTASQGQKKEVALDELEVGDRVQIQFNRREETDASSPAHQSEQMRKKHGRHRSYVGYATVITIMAPKDDDRSDFGAGKKPGEGTR